MTVAATTRASIAALERAIVQRIGEPRYQLWFASRTHFRLNGDQLTVGVPNLYAQEYLRKKFRAFKVSLDSREKSRRFATCA